MDKAGKSASSLGIKIWINDAESMARITATVKK
jgi:hypothetical protein